MKEKPFYMEEQLSRDDLRRAGREFASLSQELLKEAALYAPNKDIRWGAVSCLKDQELLASIAVRDSVQVVCREAVDTMTDESLGRSV